MRRRLASVLLTAAALCAIGEPTASAAPIPSHGDGSPALVTKVDTLVKAAIEANDIPGISVAVTRKGKLILAKGYGWRNVKTKMKMFDDTNIRIGSVTKAAITGPAAFALMDKKGIDPKTKKLYGAGGVLGDTFKGDIAIGVKRHTPILEIAITPDDKVWTWYRNGKVSKGSTPDLDQYAAPVPFSPPAGVKVEDMRAASIAKDGKVYSWWMKCESLGHDCSLRRAIGTPTDLDAHSGLSAEGASFPSGVGASNILGIGIAKSNDHLYVWYDNGKFSQGTSLDFDYYEGLKPFTTGQGAGGTSWEIRGIDIAKNDHVYVWANNGKASSGMSHDLDKYIAPYAYTFPAGQSPDWTAWYGKITLQNLLDHKAGFEGSGDQDEAMALFGVDEDDLTYTQVHKHFLRQRRLLAEPGTAKSYSNHGFGLWTLLIEKISGKAYYPYVRDSYLAPKGLDKLIVPETADAGEDCRFAARHDFQNGQIVILPFEQWGLGLAAGGFRSSARHLALLLNSLVGKYSTAELDQMGWGKSGKGKLSHNGSTGGGSALVVMFPEGYVSDDGKDLSGVNVVLIAPMSGALAAGEDAPTVGGELGKLIDKIALAVPASNVPAGYEVGKPVGPSPCTVIK